MKKTENRGLDFRGKAKERGTDVVGELVEVMEVGLKMAIKLHEYDWSSAMASGRERDAVGEMEEKDEVMDQIKENLNEALRLLKYHEAHKPESSAMASRRIQIQEPELDTKILLLRFKSRFPKTVFTGNKAAISVELIDKSTDRLVTSGPMSCVKLEVVAVKDYFNEEDVHDWTLLKDFKSHIVGNRDGKKLLGLRGDLELSLKNGVGSLGELTFTDNSSWIRPTKRIRLVVKVGSDICEGICVREAISNPFVVIDRRGEGCKKHDLPKPDDEVWRLKNIGKDGPFRKRLNEAGIFKVRDFLWKLKLSKESQELRTIVGTTMSKAKWETLVEHAETCDLSGKYYVYYADNMKSSGVVFENIFELRCLIEGGKYDSAENLSDSQKVYAGTWIRKACDNACDNWKHIEEYDGPMPSDMKPSKRPRFSPTDVATGAHTDPQVREPAIGDPPVPFSQKVAGQSTSDGQVREGPLKGILKDVEDFLFQDSPEQAYGTDDFSPERLEAFMWIDDDPVHNLPVLPDHSEQSYGTIELGVDACKKHSPPASDDEVWRLDTVGKNGPYHDRLNRAGIFKVREFLWKLGRSGQGILCEILGTSMTSPDLEALVKHATTCDLSGKYFVHYGVDTTKSSGVVFENIFELRGLIEGGVYYPAASLSDIQKLTADTWITEACDNECHRWKHIEEYHMNPRKRARSSPTDVVTGAPESFDAGQKVPTPSRTPVASGVPAVGDDIFKDLGVLPSPHPSQQDGENVNMGTGQYLLEPVLSDHSEQASPACNFEAAFMSIDDDGTIKLCVDDDDGLMPIDMNPRQRERITVPTDIRTCRASEDFGIDQQDPTLFQTPVAPGDETLVNQWLDVGDPPAPSDQQAPAPCQHQLHHSGHFEDSSHTVGADIQGVLCEDEEFRVK